MKDAITYAHEAGFFEFNVIGWKAEFERLIESVRADALAELATVKDSLTVQSSDHIADAGKVMLTTEQAQQIENAFSFAESQADYPPDDLMLYHEALYTIRAARAQELVTVVKPWAYGGSTGVNDYLMSDGSIRALTPDEVKAINAAPVSITTPDVCGEVCARAKLCYGCNKDLEEANAKYAEQAEQEPIENNDWKKASYISETLNAEQAEQEPVAAIKECLTAANTKIPAFLRRAGNFGD